MGLLVVGLVAGVLVGFAWFAPSQGHWQGCMFQWEGCSGEVASSRLEELPQAAIDSDPPQVRAKPHEAARPKKRTSTKPRKRVARLRHDVLSAKITVSTRDHRPAETSDPVLDRAKAAIAAKMDDPASAEFIDMHRAFRKNTFGRATDTICGHVRGKTASGEDTEERPFLYLVKEDDAYVVDGKPNSAAAIAYRNICN